MFRRLWWLEVKKLTTLWSFIQTAATNICTTSCTAFRCVNILHSRSTSNDASLRLCWRRLCDYHTNAVIVRHHTRHPSWSTRMSVLLSSAVHSLCCTDVGTVINNIVRTVIAGKKHIEQARKQLLTNSAAVTRSREQKAKNSSASKSFNDPESDEGLFPSVLTACKPLTYVIWQVQLKQIQLQSKSLICRSHNENTEGAYASQMSSPYALKPAVYFRLFLMA